MVISNEYLCLRISCGNPLLEAKKCSWAAAHGHLCLKWSPTAPGQATDNVGSACCPWWLRDRDTSDSTKCQTLSLYQSLLSIWLDVQIKKSTSLKAGCKAWTSIPEKKGQHFDTQLPQNGILMSRSKTWSPCSESRCLCSFHVLTFH